MKTNPTIISIYLLQIVGVTLNGIISPNSKKKSLTKNRIIFKEKTIGSLKEVGYSVVRYVEC